MDEVNQVNVDKNEDFITKLEKLKDVGLKIGESLDKQNIIITILIAIIIL